MDQKPWLGSTVNPRLGLLTWLGLVAYVVLGTCIHYVDWGRFEFTIGMTWSLGVVALWVAMSRPWNGRKLVFGLLGASISVAWSHDDTVLVRALSIVGTFFFSVSVGLPLLRMPSWLAGTEPSSQRFQFSIRALLLYTLIIASWMAVLKRHPAFMEGIIYGVLQIFGISCFGLIMARECLIKPYRKRRIILLPLALIGMITYVLFVIWIENGFRASFSQLLDWQMPIFCTTYSIVIMMFVLLGRLDNRVNVVTDNAME